MSKYGWTLWASIQDGVSAIDFDFWVVGAREVRARRRGVRRARVRARCSRRRGARTESRRSAGVRRPALGPSGGAAGARRTRELTQPVCAGRRASRWRRGGDEELRGRQRVADRRVRRVDRQAAAPARARRAVIGGGGTPSRSASHSRASERGVEDRPAQSHAGAAQRHAEERAARPRRGGRRARGRSSRRAARRARASSGGASTRSAARMPWTRIARLVERRASGARGRAPRRRGATRPSSTGSAPNEMISWRRGSSPLSSRSTTQ